MTDGESWTGGVVMVQSAAAAGITDDGQTFRQINNCAFSTDQWILVRNPDSWFWFVLNPLWKNQHPNQIHWRMMTCRAGGWWWYANRSGIMWNCGDFSMISSIIQSGAIKNLTNFSVCFCYCPMFDSPLNCWLGTGLGIKGGECGG